MELNVTQKRMDTNPIQRRLVQGESLVDRPKIVMQREYEGLDISGLNYEIRAVSEKGTMVIRPLEKAVEDDRIVLTWTVTKEFTAVDGFLALTIVGIDDTGEEIIKITSEKIIIRPDPDKDWTEPPPDVVQDALNQMASMQRAAQQAASDAKKSADNAAASSDAAAESARQAAASAGSAQTSETAAGNKAAEAVDAASSAATSRDKAKRYAEMASQVVTGSKGWFPTPEALKEQYPTGEDGWWAIVGTTDTIWIWDSDTEEWKDSGRGSGGVTVDGTASGTTYDNTESGLEAENVQEAIDELSKRESGGGNVHMDGGLDIKIKGDYPPPEEGERNTIELELDDDSDPPPDGGDDSDLKEKLEELQRKLESIQLKLNATLYVPGAGAHNSIYRGKYIGDVYTEDQKAMVAENSFDDLYIGDFWIINGVTYYVGGFNYFYNCGDTPCKTPHMIIVPDENLYTHVMNDTSTTAGGYYGSKMRTSGLDRAKEIAAAAFGADHILSHREFLTNAVTNGKPSGGAWYDCTVELMNERMVYGNAPFTPVSDGTSIPYNYTIIKGQLPLFFFRHDLIGIRVYYWLRDVITAVFFANVANYGHCYYTGASNTSGVRPYIPVS